MLTVTHKKTDNKTRNQFQVGYYVNLRFSHCYINTNISHTTSKYSKETERVPTKVVIRSQTYQMLASIYLTGNSSTFLAMKLEPN